MMSNCGFWSAAGELLAVHGADAPGSGPSSFPGWASGRRLPPGRLVEVSPGFPLPAAPGPGWHPVEGAPAARPRKTPKAVDAAAAVAVFAPVSDEAAGRLFPRNFHHDQFTWSAWPTWVSTCRPDPGEGPEGWYAALGPNKLSRFLVRLVPHRGRLPGEGWRNMLLWTVKETKGLRLVPLNSLPSAEALAGVPSWDYRAEAGRGSEAAAWDLQVIPARKLLNDWAPGAASPWEATALLRWVRPRAPSVPVSADEPLGWAGLFGRLPVADARLLVQNVLLTLPGGAARSAPLFFEALSLPAAAGRPALVRFVPLPGLPLSLLSVLFGRRVWQEVDRAKRQPVPEGDREAYRAAVLAEVDRRLAEGRLTWSDRADALWEAGYREPLRRAGRRELAAYRAGDRWNQLLGGPPRRAEALLRRLDVTDLALCLRDAPDRRWRRFVTQRREDEIAAEVEFCRIWAARGELTLDRELDAWRSWDRLLAELPLTEPDPSN